MKKVFIFCLLFLFSSFCKSLDYTQFSNHLEPYKKLECYNSVVTFVMDDAGNQYVVKQIKFNDKYSRLAKLICEMVALDVGHAVGIPLNSACIIPPGKTFIGKRKGVPVTVHTVVPGMRFDTYQKSKRHPRYKNLNIRQKEPDGLSRRIIRQMSYHNDLPALVAYDTFVGNADRGQNNFFYESSTDTFYGIDMAGSFSKDLCAASAQNIKKMLQNKKLQLSKAEKRGLVSYYNTMDELVRQNDASELCMKVDDYAGQAGFYDNNFFDMSVQAKCVAFIEKRKKKIVQQYTSAIKLLGLLKQLLENIVK